MFTSFGTAFYKFSSTSVFHTSYNAWQAGKVSPENEREMAFYCPDRCGHTAVCIKEELLIWGGYNEKNVTMYCDNKTLWVYNLDLDVWAQYRVTGRIPQKRSGACSALIWPYWYIFCGHADNRNVNDMHRLDLINLHWEKIYIKEPSISPRDKASAWVYGNRIYCFGGFGVMPYFYLWDKNSDVFSEESWNERGWNNQLLYFDTDKTEWVNVLCKGPKPKERAAHSAVCVDGKVYLFGGRHRTQRLNDLHCLNLEMHTWSGSIESQGCQPSGRSWHTMTQLSKTELLLFGGFDNSRMPLDDIWQLNIVSFSWTVLVSHTSSPRLWHSANVSAQGDTLFFGGCISNILDEIYQMTTSDKVLVLRKQPFSLERLSLHALIRYKDQTSSQWNVLLKPHQEWLSQKSALLLEFRPAMYKHCAESVLGPSLCQLSVLSEKEAEVLNESS